MRKTHSGLLRISIARVQEMIFFVPIVVGMCAFDAKLGKQLGDGDVDAGLLVVGSTILDEEEHEAPVVNKIEVGDAFAQFGTGNRAHSIKDCTLGTVN